MPRRSAKRPKPPPIILCSRAVFSADPSVTKNLLYNKDNTFGEKSQEGNTEKSPDFFVSILSALHRISFSREISAFDSRKRKNPWRSAGIFVHSRFVLEADVSACFAVLSTSSILSGNRFLVIYLSVKVHINLTKYKYHKQFALNQSRLGAFLFALCNLRDAQL